jgi:hypothetical protein
MPRDDLSLAEYTGAVGALEALPEGLDFGNDFNEDADDATTVADLPDTDADAADTGDVADDDAGEALGGTDADDAGDDAGDGADADADPEPAPAAKEKGDKEPRIPKSRLDQSIRKQRLAEQRAQELEAEIAQLRSASAEAARPKPLTSDEIKAKMTEANDALIAGDTEKAASLQAELFSALTPQAPAPVERGEPVDLAAEVEERIAFKAVVKDMYARFPELDENHELFDDELGGESVELQKSYMRRGYSMVEATQKAAEAVAKLHDLEDRRAEKAPVPAPSKDKSVQAAKTAAKVAVAAKAPPVLAGKANGEGSGEVNINQLNDDEFMALPQSVRDKLLGNTL